MENNIDILSEKILKGLEISFKRLLDKKIKENGELVFGKYGKIIHVKGDDLLKLRDGKSSDEL